MRAAVDDVHHRHRQGHVGFGDGGQVLPQRLLARGGHGMRGSQRDPQQRVGAQAALVLGAVKIDQATVQALLVGRIEVLQRLGDGAVDVVHRVAHALAQVAGLVAITQLHRFLGTGRGTRRHGRAAERTVVQRDFGLQRGIAAGVEDFAGEDLGDSGHRSVRLPVRGSTPETSCRIIAAHRSIAKSHVAAIRSASRADR